MVYVLDMEGKLLMPTERHGKVRRLLRDGQAHVVRLQPFTIQLDYESTTYRQQISLGIDAGSVHIGVSATTEKKELFAAEVILRTDIVKNIASRLEMRRNRRYRKTRYRQARFDNRRKTEGWLAPSIRYKVESHLKVIRMVYSLLPVSKTTIEVAQFDAQKIKNETDKQVTVTVAEAKKQADVLEGEGESEYMRILSEAYNDPAKASFYNFVRSLDSLDSLVGDDNVIILDQNSELGRILNGSLF